MVKSRSVIATPPGATIKEQLMDRGMSQKEFAIRMELSEKHISKLVNGEVQLTPDVAVRLEMVLGIPAQFWSNLEAIYREKLVKAEYENKMDADVELAKDFPYSEMSKHNWVPATKKTEEKVLYLRKFFEVTDLSLLQKNDLIPRIACRRLSITEKSDTALIVWAQQAKLASRSVPTAPINLKKLERSIPEIRSMTIMDPNIFCKRLVNLLSSCGIALVFLPHMKGSFLHGATFYDGNKIVIGLTVRGKDADRFWFSLFHELGHILLGHVGNVNGTSDEEETAADSFARETLIPQKQFNIFVVQNDFTKPSILLFSKLVEIAPGIMVGRLQKEGYIPYSWYNDLKTKYEICT